MNTKKMRYVWFLVILCIFCLTLFLARTRSKVEMRNRIYRQWNEHFVVSKGKESYVRTTNDSNQTVVLSEAQSYGMIITVAAAEKGQAQQADFDRLYHYYLNHRLEGTQLKAAQKWPKQAKDYQAQAKAILEDILAHNYNEETGVLTVGNWANQDSEFYHLMRTSDTLPAQFQIFYEVTKDSKWLDIKEKMLQQLQTISSQTKTGLLPDFIWVDEQGTRVADPKTIESKYDGAYSYNACRLPYNLVQSKDKTSQQ